VPPKRNAPAASHHHKDIKNRERSLAKMATDEGFDMIIGNINIIIVVAKVPILTMINDVFLIVKLQF